MILIRIRQISLSCSRHKDRLAMLHCTTCDLPVCCACSMTTTHCDHDRQDIDDFVEDQRQQLRDQIRHVESYQRQVDDQISRTRRDSDKLIGKFDQPVTGGVDPANKKYWGESIFSPSSPQKTTLVKHQNVQICM